MVKLSTCLVAAKPIPASKHNRKQYQTDTLDIYLFLPGQPQMTRHTDSGGQASILWASQPARFRSTLNDVPRFRRAPLPAADAVNAGAQSELTYRAPSIEPGSSREPGTSSVTRGFCVVAAALG